MRQIPQKQFEAAKQLLGQALVLALSKTSGDSKEAADVLNNFAVLETARQDFAEADNFLAKAETMYGRLYGADHPLIVNGLNNRAFIARMVKDDAKAERFERTAKEMDARMKAKQQ